MADLAITISVPDEQLPRLLDGFRKQWGRPELTTDELLLLLKENAVQQMKAVVRNQEVNAAKAAAENITELDIA